MRKWQCLLIGGEGCYGNGTWIVYKFALFPSFAYEYSGLCFDVMV